MSIVIPLGIRVNMRLTVKRNLLRNDFCVPDKQCHLNNKVIISSLACVYRVMDARRKFGVHERSVRIAGGAVESNYSSVLSVHEPTLLLHSDNNLGAKTCFICDLPKSSQNLR